MIEDYLMTMDYVGTKQVTAWEQAHADGRPGYAVKYPDGYTSWSPKDVFEAAYIQLGHISHLPPHQQRMIAESVQLDEKVQKLSVFTGTRAFNDLPGEDRDLLLKQCTAMIDYLEILTSRIERIGLASQQEQA